MIPQLALVRRFFAETESQFVQLGLVAAEALFSSIIVTIVPWSLGGFFDEVIFERSPAYDWPSIILVFSATALLFSFRFLSQVVVHRTVRSNAKMSGAKFLIRLRARTNLELDSSLKNDVARILALPLSGIAPTIRFAASLVCLSILAIALNQQILFEPFTTAGGIILALFFFTLILTYIKALPDAFLTIELASESATRVFAVLDRAPELADSGPPQPQSKLAPQIRTPDEISADFR